MENFSKVSISNFTNYFLVNCPDCYHRAIVKTIDNNDNSVRLTCLQCSCIQSWQPTERSISRTRILSNYEKGVYTIGANVDPYFHQPLWLNIPCCGNELWAYNIEHLDWLETYVSSKTRDRSKDATDGWSNKSLASRLPKWISASKNRDDVLRAIKKLRLKLNN